MEITIAIKAFLLYPDENRWGFRLYPSPEKDSPTWSGRFDEFKAKMENVEIQGRSK